MRSVYIDHNNCHSTIIIIFTRFHLTQIKPTRILNTRSPHWCCAGPNPTPALFQQFPLDVRARWRLARKKIQSNQSQRVLGVLEVRSTVKLRLCNPGKILISSTVTTKTVVRLDLRCSDSATFVVENIQWIEEVIIFESSCFIMI